MERRRGFGFTLIELLAVITIIVILAGLTVGGMKFFSQTSDLWLALFGDSDNDKSDYEKDDDQEPYLGELDPKASAQGWLLQEGERYVADASEIHRK